jgi:hypothetical protein
MQCGDMVVGLSDGVDQFMKGPLLFVDLLLPDVALRNKVIVFSLVLDVCEVDLVHDAGVVFFKELHVADEILLVVLQDCLYSLLASLILTHYQVVRLRLPAGEEGLQLLIHEEGLVNGEEVLIFRLLIHYFASVGGVDAILNLANFKRQELSLLL